MTEQTPSAALRQATTWQKSSYSQGASDCVEITTDVPGWVGVRDSKLGGSSPVLAFSQGEWNAFIAGAKAGEFDGQHS
ncbi:DUF397 domain-containing protein [Haloechinothrix halophila]|uniref:DUF397 domain-containing protein n=1 Tax=Haloechinothrix halophila TaxID=1069073 RepID=UPI0005540684|nr:DUF397 domain-containing protein [Haloechinothrix halophila]